MNNHEQVSDQVFHVLITLVDGPRHGYGIIQEVEARTGGELKRGSGEAGRALVRAEARRLASLVEFARAKDLLASSAD